jgi:hypothetical protein
MEDCSVIEHRGHGEKYILCALCLLCELCVGKKGLNTEATEDAKGK